MVNNDCHSITRMASAVSAEARSASAARGDLRIEYLPPERLRPSPNNARRHSRKQLKQLANSIARFGFINPVLISDDFEIIAGHGRLEAAKRLGLGQVPTVRLSNLSPAERRAYLIADNRLAQLAGWDRELLASELQGLLDLKFDDIELTGFSLDQVELMLDDPAEQNGQPGPEEQPSPNSLQGPAVSRAGDVWRLGQHRLLCGETQLFHCDVVIRRWQQYSGIAARLEGSDQTFADVEATRLAGHSTSAA
jgi:ParB/Sulfiredoxin domain